jgi:uncharacterized membrane protein
MASFPPALAALALLAAAAGATARDYAATVLPDLSPRAINDAGVIVGTWHDAGHVGHAARRNADGTLTVLSDERSEAADVDRDGDVVGTIGPPGTRRARAMLWRAGGEAVNVGAGRAVALRRGVVLGQLGNTAPWRWHDGRLQWLPVPADAYWVSVEDMNDEGVVVGQAQVPEAIEFVPLRWTAEGTRERVLPTFGFDAAAYGIDDAGTVVGQADAAIGEFQAAVWHDGQVFHLAGFPHGNGNASAWRLNAAGTIVGQAQHQAGYGFGAVWPDAGSPAADLNDWLPADLKAVGWVVTDATGINGPGAIVATLRCVRAGCPTDPWGVLFTPLP